MEDPKKQSNAPCLGLHGPHWNQDDGQEVPPGLVPLRLVFQPSGLALEVTRPEVLVGRHSLADVRLVLPDVSRRHCRFVFSQGNWQVFDLSSLNGLWVNGIRVQQALLHHRDVIGVGSYTFEVDLCGGGQTLRLPDSGTGADGPERPGGEPKRQAS